MIQQAIRQAGTALNKDFGYSPQVARWLTIQYMGNNKVIREVAKKEKLTPLLNQTKYYDAQKFADKIFNTRLQFIEKTLNNAR